MGESFSPDSAFTDVDATSTVSGTVGGQQKWCPAQSTGSDGAYRSGGSRGDSSGDGTYARSETVEQSRARRATQRDRVGGDARLNGLMAILVIVVKTLNLALGGLVTLYAYRAYRRSGSEPMLVFASGFGVITAGTLLAGFADQILALASGAAILAQSLFTTIGFLIILYSIHV